MIGACTTCWSVFTSKTVEYTTCPRYASHTLSRHCTGVIWYPAADRQDALEALYRVADHDMVRQTLWEWWLEARAGQALVGG